jgi:hypothetical protein
MRHRRSAFARIALRWALWLSAATLAGSCGGSAPSPARLSARPGAARPRLVVLVVYDQIGSWVLAEHAPHLDPEGAVRWISGAGLHVERARYEYAGTYTAPGHTAIVSGLGPRDSGVTSNRVWSRARGARISSFDDGVHPIVGRADGFAGLGVMRAQTVADRLFSASEGRARIVALGMKDRSALPMGGHHPSLSLWFDALAGGFTTSSELRAELPAWVLAFREEHPWQSYRRVWEPLRPYPELGPDEQPGEGAYGFGASFPHDPTGLEEIDAFLCLPSASEMLLALAERAVREEALGADEQPDFLAISIGGTDFVGHGFGPESWEARDELVRVDAMVGRFLASLAERTEIAVVLTADHGVAPLPERAAEHALPSSARRWSSAAELPLLRAHLDRTLGPRTDTPEGQGWVAAWVVPWIYLPEPVTGDPTARARAVDAIRSYLLARPGIGFVVDRLEAPSLRDSEDENLRLLERAIDPEASGDVYVLPSEGSIADDTADATGTGHGSPFLYDRDVPVLVRGPGVSHGVVRAPVAQSRVAATLAHLLGVEPPHAAEPLLTGE